ncbi:hypothetical protein [Spirilliplanes yamanashiensis]|uniref:hypothetical protein n=1 Tax=Spirilliplanes yamanashiensis TaxID=42233 RepID=UPI00195197E6|nr:hypothetical protein [Spirilliplanes yamanashiensis]MDP9819971.1 hypothetical protein [Spirilliplanes yamanashiensis]
MNELAAKGLCDPLIPSDTAGQDDYFRIFVKRVANAADVVRTQGPDALLVLVVDAADNAVLVAGETGAVAFAPGLLREQLPTGTRLVMLCRSERLDILDPPPGRRTIALSGFTSSESATLLRASFPGAADRDAAEFHALTGGNPRVQVTALGSAQSLPELLSRLGQFRESKLDGFNALMQELVERLKDQHHGSSEIDQICVGLAALRPMIPIRVLARLAQVDAALVESFVADLGHPLLIDGGTVQFRDEPTETWFRENFRPVGEDLDHLLSKLKPIAAEDPYAAASIPALLWEARRVDELLRLALSDEALPFDDVDDEQLRSLQRTEIDQERAQFALKAALREGREFEAGRLALKVGALTAGRTRRLQLIRQNTDLAAAFLDSHIVEQLIAGRNLTGDWPNSNLPAEGALLSGAAGRTHQARNRLRSAQLWMSAWTRNARERGERPRIGRSDIALVAWGLLNTDGAEACAEYLRRWTPDTVAFDAGIIVARRLLDAGRFAEVNRLASVDGPPHLAFAVAQACAEVGQELGAPAVRRVIKALSSTEGRLSVSDRAAYGSTESRVHDNGVAAVIWAVAFGRQHDLLSDLTGAELLSRYLPEDLGHRAGDRYERDTLELLVGFALLARLRGQQFDLDAIAAKEVREAQNRPAYASSSSRAQTYRANVAPLAGWLDLYVDVLLGTDLDLWTRHEKLDAFFAKSYSYDPPHFLLDAICRIAIRALAAVRDDARGDRFVQFCISQVATLARATLTQVVRISAGHPHLHGVAVETATAVRTSIDETRGESGYNIESLIALARATYRLGGAEARAHFEQAAALADRVGDDAHVRWATLLQIADAAGAADRRQPERAYRLAQVAENLEPYVGDRVDLAQALQKAGKLDITTAIAVGSRWRDRRTATISELARALLASDEALLHPMPLVAVALLPLGDHWWSLDVITRAMRQDPERAGTILKVLSEFERAVKHSAEDFRRLDDVATETHTTLEGTCFAADVRTVFEPASYVSRMWSETDGADVPSRHHDGDIPRFELTSATGWAEALAMAKDHDGHRNVRLEHVYEQAGKVAAFQKAVMVAAFRDCPQADLFDVDRLLNSIGPPQSMPYGLRAEVKNLARTAVARFCREIVGKSWQPINLEKLAQAAGEPGADYVGQAQRAAGATARPLDAEEAFALAGRLAGRVSPEQAGVLLDEGLRLFAEVAEVNAGDGRFESLPPAPESIAHAVAGTLWATLADVEDANRWRAAHSVRLLLALDCRDVTGPLLDLAMGRTSPVLYVDGRLPFYEKHARQWLLLGLARAAQELDALAATAQFEPLLRQVLFDDDPHVVMQHSAQSAIVAMSRHGFDSLDQSDTAAALRIGSPTAVTETNRWGTGRRVVHRLADISTLLEDESCAESADAVIDDEESDDAMVGPADGDSREPRFRFFMDFTDHWCSALGNAFDISAGSIQELIEEILLDRWGTSFRGKYDEDPRHQLRLYNRDKYSHKSEYPHSDDLNFYLSSHALFELAGRLIDALPVIVRAGEDESEWEEFLNRHVITRRDGRWLADRRDAAPPDELRDPGDGLADGSSREHLNRRWKQGLAAADCLAQLSPTSEWVTVWLDSWAATYTRTEVVNVMSALVNATTGPALLRALETAPDKHAFRLPGAGDEDFEIDVPDFRLTGWLHTPGHRSGIDERDPYSGGIKFPPVRPTADIVGTIGAVPDLDLRTWSIGSEPALRSLVWSDVERGGASERGSVGQRLTMRRADLTELLRRTGRSLIVEVKITRRCEESHSRSSPIRSPDDDNTAPRKCTKYFLFDQFGIRHEL